MPSFNPQGTQRAFVRQDGGDGFKPRPQDLLVTIESYNIGQGIMNCVDTRDRKISARISAAAISRNEARKAANPSGPTDIQWEGYCIDERMAKHLKVGHRIVLERAVSKRAPIKQNNQTLYIYEADRVVNVSDPSPEKTFEGLFTVSTYEGRIFQVQHWAEKAIDINDVTAIENIRRELDEINNAYVQKQFLPTVGIQFRTVAPGANANDPYVVLDTSPPFDWVPREKDENGVEISPGHPLDGNTFIGYVSGYTDYALGKFPKEQHPGVFVEMIRYVNFKASGLSRYMAVPENQYDPLFTLSHTQTKLAIDDGDFVQGKNYAVRGILQLSANKPDNATQSWIVRNIAQRLHANGAKGHVHAWVRSFDGHKTSPHEALRQVPTVKNGPASADHRPAPSAPTPAPSAPQSSIGAPAAQAPSTPMDDQSGFGGDDDWPGFEGDDHPFGDGFGNSGDVSAAQAAVAAARSRMNQG